MSEQPKSAARTSAKRSRKTGKRSFLRKIKAIGFKPILIGAVCILLLILLIFGIRSCGSSHKSPEKAVKTLVEAYVNGKQSKIKDCYGAKKDTPEELQTEIDATIKYFQAHAPKSVTIEKCDTLSENGNYVYVYVIYKLTLENGQEYPCLSTYMTQNKEGKYYVLSPSEITEDMSKQAATDYAKFMTTDAYKSYVTAYDTFIKKNPGYEDKIAGKLS